MKKIIGISFLIITSSYSFSQQMPQYSQYLRNQFMVNPAAAGVYGFTDVTISGRLQWQGFTNAPMSSYASVCAPISKAQKVKYNPSLRMSTGPVVSPEVETGKLKHAIGGQLATDEYGAFRKVSFSGTYAIHLPLDRAGKYNLSFGAKIGMTNNAFIQERAVVLNPTTDATYTGYVANQSNQNIMNIGSGLYLYSSKLFLGISADQLTRDMVSFGTSSSNFDSRIHTYITAGFKVIDKPTFTLTPALLVKYMSPAPPCIEGSIQAVFNNRFWAAVSYRNTDAIVGALGLTISNKFKFGYSYDYSVSKLKNYANGSHELVLGIMLGRTVSTSSIPSL